MTASHSPGEKTVLHFHGRERNNKPHPNPSQQPFSFHQHERSNLAYTTGLTNKLAPNTRFRCECPGLLQLTLRDYDGNHRILGDKGYGSSCSPCCLLHAQPCWSLPRSGCCARCPKPYTHLSSQPLPGTACGAAGLLQADILQLHGR